MSLLSILITQTWLNREGQLRGSHAIVSLDRHVEAFSTKFSSILFPAMAF
jgi:hypothetical protein